MLTLQLALAPALVGVSSLACRRWGERIGGLLSAFPAIVGPFLLIAAHEHGARFAAQAANGTLMGLVGLGGFAVAYARTALHAGWRWSLAAGWAAAALLSGLAAGSNAPAPAGLLAGGCSLLIARWALRATSRDSGRTPTRRGDTALRITLTARMILTTLLVAGLALAADRFGSLLGGALAALPALASVLAVFTHRQRGAAAALTLLRGMLSGMAGFVLFCETIALLVVPGGIAVAFSAATVGALLAQGLLASGVDLGKHLRRDNRPIDLRGGARPIDLAGASDR